MSAVLVLAAVASRDRSLEVTQVGFEKKTENIYFPTNLLLNFKAELALLRSSKSRCSSDLKSAREAEKEKEKETERCRVEKEFLDEV